jgi:HD-like signal output (HDOD) protein
MAVPEAPGTTLAIDRITPPLGLDVRSLPGFAASDPVSHLAEKIRARFRAPGYCPPMLPQVALEVQRSANSPNATFASVAAILEKDAMLTARVLRLSRSPAYARAVGVRSIREAVGRLGLKAVTELVWRAALDIGIFRSTQHRRTLDLLRRHSTVTAYLARTAALFTPVPVEYAFLAGLVHDIGLAAALIVLSEEPGGSMLSDREVRAVAAVHEELSGMVARLWNLPEDLQAGIAQHHRLGENGDVHPLSAVVLIAEHLAISLGAPQPLAAAGWDPVDRQRLKLAHTALELSPAQLKIVEAEAKNVLGDMAEA